MGDLIIDFSSIEEKLDTIIEQNSTLYTQSTIINQSINNMVLTNLTLILIIGILCGLILCNIYRK